MPAELGSFDRRPARNLDRTFELADPAEELRGAYLALVCLDGVW